MNDASVIFEQALFGYDDGHRLLEASTRLGASESEKLLLLTDLAPGVSNLRADGYWTGSPLQETSRYALMRTWPAPEMPRPGCVWTYVLLIPFTYLENAWNLTHLLHLFTRPTWPHDRNSYSSGVRIGVIDSVARESNREETAFTESDLTDCVYFRQCKGITITSQATLGLQAFELWSQQWPKLRCSFSFRTIGRPTFGKSPLLSFDLGISEGQLQFQYDSPVSAVQSALWDIGDSRAELARDLSASQPTRLRKFILRYGEDLPVRATWMPFLAWVRRTASDVSDGSVKPTFLLEEVAKALPETEAGYLLKSELLNFSTDAEISLPASAFPEALEFILEDARGKSFPPFQESACKLVKVFWNDAPQQLLRLVGIAIDRGETPITSGILDYLSHVPDTAGLMDATTEWPTVRAALVKRNPALLEWKGLIRVNDDELIQLLETLTDEDVVHHGVVAKLIPTPSIGVAAYLCRRFSAEVLREVCIGRGCFGYNFRANDYVLQRAGEMASQYLSESFLGELRSTSSLYSFASMLGFINARTIEVGALPWSHSLRTASMDAKETESQILRAFLLALAIARPQKGSESIFEYSFEPIHRAMRNSGLPYQASTILEPQLPEVSWWRSWDSCERLRLAVVGAYVQADLDTISFLRLSNDSYLMGQMFEILESDDQALGYLNKVRATLATRNA